ncbi:uncharacterized protein L969DRAFT_24078 [Mixia osmundae IAM 14324]|uniref:Uncharacterized protein n=1 Tax=Mixia osmundae (strain CBS 9802 / IAM 14324 / JCM 22182 / KY 12970) TaxID=764103 RepID=G7DVR4_MIXOS|nr:uncharacterized protein L969DRAFT_24078 [Mixia osmundae IAM 14324]KEI39645.1 hypothetical protein L969DRAFT_24078 [Mixia osmundae IAM 14324]GAA94674.1 hypothetical protein E5Q_01327 [Mixia osmundae IAM 14324]
MQLPPHQLHAPVRSNIVQVSVNQDGSLFTTAELSGWSVWQTSPLQLISRRDFPQGSLKLVVPLHRTNLIWLVGGPPSPLYSPNKVIIYDDNQARPILAFEFSETVRAVQVRRDRFVVVLRRRVILFAFNVISGKTIDVWREGVYPTIDNPQGLAALASGEGATLLAFPGRQPGHVNIVNLPALDSKRALQAPPPGYDSTLGPPYPSISIIVAHRTHLACLVCSSDGARLATASSKGTLVRIWDVATARALHELRRGTDVATIFSMRFNPDASLLALSSDKGTIHIWHIGDVKGKSRAVETDQQAKLDMFRPYLPRYFSSAWSSCQYRLPVDAPPPSRKLPKLPKTPSALRSASTDPVKQEAALIAAESAARKKEARIEAKLARLSLEDEVSHCIWPQAQSNSPELIVITHAGRWFRLALPSPAQEDTAETATDCRLLEYHKLAETSAWAAFA